MVEELIDAARDAAAAFTDDDPLRLAVTGVMAEARIARLKAAVRQWDEARAQASADEEDE